MDRAIPVPSLFISVHDEESCVVAVPHTISSEGNAKGAMPGSSRVSCHASSLEANSLQHIPLAENKILRCKWTCAEGAWVCLNRPWVSDSHPVLAWTCHPDLAASQAAFQSVFHWGKMSTFHH